VHEWEGICLHILVTKLERGALSGTTITDCLTFSSMIVICPEATWAAVLFKHNKIKTMVLKCSSSSNSWGVREMAVSGDSSRNYSESNTVNPIDRLILQYSST
jgi:hypothetical protein